MGVFLAYLQAWGQGGPGQWWHLLVIRTWGLVEAGWAGPHRLEIYEKLISVW